MRVLTDAHFNFVTLLDRLVPFGMLCILVGIQTAAMVMQYVFGEIPCPLCLLQRYALFGCCFGLVLQLRPNASMRSTGLSILFTLLLLVISARQVLINLFPRPGHEYVGSAIFGIHMPVWSVIIALALLFGFGCRLLFFGGIYPDVLSDKVTLRPWFERLVHVLIFYLVLLCAINFVSVIIQCGLGECSTLNYRLLRLK